MEKVKFERRKASVNIGEIGTLRDDTSTVAALFDFMNECQEDKSNTSDNKDSKVMVYVRNNGKIEK